MSQTDPVRRWQAGKTPVTAKRMNELADRASQLTKDRPPWESGQAPVVANTNEWIGRVREVKADEKVAICERVIGDLRNINDEELEEKYRYLVPGDPAARSGIMVYIGDEAVAVGDLIDVRFSGMGIIPSWRLNVAADKSFWGIITSCVKVGGVWTGSFKVRKLTGRLVDNGGLPKLDPTGVNGLKEIGTSEIEVYQGDGWHQVGDPVHCIPSGEGVTPAFIVEQRIGGTNHWVAPNVVTPLRPAGTNDLNEVQDLPAAKECQ